MRARGALGGGACIRAFDRNARCGEQLTRRRRLVNLRMLKPGHKIRVADGAEAEVLSETEDGSWIRVRYLDADDALSSGTEDLVHGDDVEALLGVAERKEWGEQVTVVLHHIPESEEGEGGYEAVTMTGVPEKVSVAGSAGSAEDALNHLMAGLRAFGFLGRVAVEDATYIGGGQRYEVEI